MVLTVYDIHFRFIIFDVNCAFLAILFRAVVASLSLWFREFRLLLKVINDLRQGAARPLDPSPPFKQSEILAELT